MAKFQVGDKVECFTPYRGQSQPVRGEVLSVSEKEIAVCVGLAVHRYSPGDVRAVAGIEREAADKENAAARIAEILKPFEGPAPAEDDWGSPRGSEDWAVQEITRRALELLDVYGAGGCRLCLS